MSAHGVGRLLFLRRRPRADVPDHATNRRSLFDRQLLPRESGSHGVLDIVLGDLLAFGAVVKISLIDQLAILVKNEELRRPNSAEILDNLLRGVQQIRKVESLLLSLLDELLR